MPTKKKAKATKKTGAAAKTKARPKPQHTEAYKAAEREYERALQWLREQDYGRALTAFKQAESQARTPGADAPELAERARTYVTICGRKLEGPPAEPQTNEERYHRAVLAANAGRLDRAIELLDSALQNEPGNASLLYARASAHALQGNTESTVSDLRQAIAIDPTIRYQAINDPDFERVRDDAAFIDVIEPTPTGA